jgi:hypothetical protein
MNDNDVDVIAASLHVLRPDWPSGQIRTLIRENLLDRPRRDVLVALTWVAGDVASHTPYRVLETGPWWKAAGADRTTPEPAERHDPGRLCSVCSQPEERCRRIWAGDHDYLSNDDLAEQVADQDPLVRSMIVTDLRHLSGTLGQIPEE